MILNNKILAGIGILGFAAGVYMMASNIFFNKEFSYFAIGAGLLSPLYSYVSWNRSKDK